MRKPWISFLLLTLLAALGAAAQSHFVDATVAANLGGYMASSGDGHGPGGIFADLNNDSFPDFYGVRSGAANELYENVPGIVNNTRVFAQVAGNGGAGDTGPATGAIAGDYDNDGDLDIFVTNFDAPNVLLQNQLADSGSFTFVDVTAAAGLGDVTFEMVVLNNALTAAWGDVNLDGYLDLYVGNHDGWCNNPIERAVPGQRDIFYMNTGNGTFTEATMQYGLTGFETSSGQGSTATQWYSSTNAVIFADFNNDRWPDLLVTNKVGGGSCQDRDMLYINQGNDAVGWLGYQLATYTLTPTFGQMSGAAMGVDVGDPDNDGDLDIYITDWSDPNNPTGAGSNDVWINGMDTGTLSFNHYGGLDAAWGWGCQWQDFNNDGFQDLHAVTQLIAGNQYWRDYFWANLPSGMTEMAAFLGVDQVRQARGDLAADYDKDGWVDLLVINTDNVNGPSVLWENRLDGIAANHYLTLELQGDPGLPGRKKSSRDAIGARVEVTADLNGDGSIAANEVQIREVVSGNSNATSTSSLALEFGLGLATTADVKVLWPSGRRTDRTKSADQCAKIKETKPVQQTHEEPKPVP